MINGISGSPPVEWYQTQSHQQSAQTHKNSQGDQEPEDSVVLSKKASESADVDHAATVIKPRNG